MQYGSTAVNTMDSDSVLIWYVCPIVAVVIAIWCFKDVFYRGPYRRFCAWIEDIQAPDMDKAVKKQKQLLFQLMHDYRENVKHDLKILDIGSGSAPNLKYFPADTDLVCLEPNPFSEKLADKNIKSQEHVKSVEFVNGYSEDIPLESDTFDIAICTLVLCTVSDVPKSLEEIQRVLKPDGKFLFLEHVVAERNTWARLMQSFMNPVTQVLFDGCRTDRDTEKVIRESNMRDIHVERFQADDLPFWLKPFIFGNCSK